MSCKNVYHHQCWLKVVNSRFPEKCPAINPPCASCMIFSQRWTGTTALLQLPLLCFTKINIGHYQPEQTEVLERLSSWPSGHLLAKVHHPSNKLFWAKSDPSSAFHWNLPSPSPGVGLPKGEKYPHSSCYFVKCRLGLLVPQAPLLEWLQDCVRESQLYYSLHQVDTQLSLFQSHRRRLWATIGHAFRLN